MSTTVHLGRGLTALAEHFTRKLPNGQAMWNGGLGDVVRTAIQESNLPQDGITAVDLARKVGILKPRAIRRRSC